MSVSATRAPLPILTSLRFFAAAEVVVYHGNLPWQMDFIHGLTLAGYQAVTFFFVLSGFILTYVYTGNSEHISINVTARTFWKARIARISPAYFFALLVSLPAFAYGALISKVVPITSLFLGLALVPIFQQAWWPPAATLWNVPAWSLSVEFLFYALFPLLERITARLSRSYFIALAYGLVVAMTMLRFNILSPNAPVGSYVSSVQNFDFFFPLFHIPQFIYGMALGRLYLFGSTFSPKISASMFWVGTLGLVLVFGARSLLPWWTQTDAALVLLFGLTIFGGARGETSLRWLAFPTITLLGEASYSIYILHIPIWFWWNWFTRRIFHSSLPAFQNFATYFVLVVVASVLCYLYVEKPMRRWILGHREHRDA
jgi:peptidoglycan/LPS O-acetylase OafA/YrhL